MKWINQVEKDINSAKSITAQISNSFSYFDAEIVKLLYVSLVRPHLEFEVSFWNPCLKRDIEKLEGVQHMTTRLDPKLNKKSYEGRLKTLEITTLEERRRKGYLIQFYKVLNGIDQIEWKNKLVKTIQEDEGGPAARNLRREGVCFHELV